MIKGTATVVAMQQAKNLPAPMRSEDHVVATCEVVFDGDDCLEPQELEILVARIPSSNTLHPGEWPVALGQKLIVTIEKAKS